MCSIEDLGENYIIEKKIRCPTVGSACRTCTEKAEVLRGKDPLCRSCFLSYCTHKFRATLGKSKLLNAGEKVLVAFSGGTASAAMLHMIKEGLKEASHKRLIFSPSLVFIDDSAILPQKGVDLDKTAKEIMQIMLRSQYPCYISHLEMAFRTETGKKDFYHTISAAENAQNSYSTEEEKGRLKKAIDSLTSLSSKEDFVKRLRYKLLSDIAKNVGCTKVFVGDSATWLSIQLLAGIAQGHGAHLSAETGFVDSRYDVEILRPMREFLSREISIYNHFQKIPFIIRPALSTKADVKSSVLRLTENFVVSLQSQFPATVSTVYRTGDKLCPDYSKISEERCVLCHSHLDTLNPDTCSALEALHLTRRLCLKSEAQPTESSYGACCSGETDCCQERNLLDPLEIRNEYYQHMCYSCRITIKEMRNPDLLPNTVLNSIKKRSTRYKMKMKIQEFLLDDEDGSN